MKKTLLALISIITLGLTTLAQANTVYIDTRGSGAVMIAPPAHFPPTVTAHTDIWGQTVVTVTKNPKQESLEFSQGMCGLGFLGCAYSAGFGVLGIADICKGLRGFISGSSDKGVSLLMNGGLKVGGAALFGTLGYIAFKVGYKGLEDLKVI
jgi:hypothetical protein